MEKFPLLNTYRGLMNLIGVLIIIGGFYLAYQYSQTSVYTGYGYSTQVQPVYFGIIFSISVVFAAGFLVSAELIKVFVRIESHLDSIRHIQESESGISRIQASTSTSRPSQGASVAYAAGNIVGNALKPTTPSQNYPLTSKYDPFDHVLEEEYQGVTLKAVVNAENTFVRKAPGRTFSVQDKLIKGTELRLYGRTTEGNWTEIEGNGQSWVETSHLQIDGDVMILPVVEAT